MPVSQTPVYNLKFVLRETDISADTLRAWERRYGLPKPQRSPGGHRLYSQYDIELVKWLIARLAEGFSISRAVDLWRENMTQGLDPLSGSPSGTATAPGGYPSLPGLFPADFGLDTMRSQWVSACLTFNETVVEQVLNQAFALYPVETVFLELLQKGLGEIGELWYAGKASVQHEHFASALALRRLDALIAATPAPTRQQTVMVACPPDEWHTFSPLILTLFLRRRGLQVTYLGANVPLARFGEAIQQAGPDVLVLSAQRLHTAHTLQQVAGQLAGTRIGYGGRIFNDLPSIREHIPAVFLGADIPAAIQNIEKILMHNYQASQNLSAPAEMESLLQQFQRSRLRIEAGVMLKIADSDLMFEYITAANDFMAESLSAALALGDPGLVTTDFDWVHGYLGNISVSPSHLPIYLSLYAQAVETEMGMSGKPIVDSLIPFTDKMSKGV